MQRMFRLSSLALFALLLIVLFSARSSHAQTAPATLTPIPPKVTVQAGRTIVISTLASNGSGSLVDAIENAAPDDIITFDPGLSGEIMIKANDPANVLYVNSHLTIRGSADQKVILRNFSLYMLTQSVVTLYSLAFKISNLSNGGILSVNDCTFEYSTIANGGVVSVANSIFHSSIDKAINAGSIGNTATIINSTFYENDIGVFVSDGSAVLIINSTFHANRYAIFNRGVTQIYNTTIQTVITADDRGMALVNADTSFTLKLHNTIVSEIRAETPQSSTFQTPHKNCNGTIDNADGNLQFPAGSCASDIPAGDPMLGPLQDNGGATWTMALLSGSAAIGKISADKCPASDQRGLPLSTSSVKAMCDIGAFQTNATSMITASPATPITPTAVK